MRKGNEGLGRKQSKHVLTSITKETDAICIILRVRGGKNRIKSYISYETIVTSNFQNVDYQSKQQAVAFS
jgi:hypothetical protein